MGVVDIEFNAELPSSTDLSSVKILHNGSELTRVATVTEEGNLHLEISGMVADEVYDLFVPAGLGVSGVAQTTQKVLKRFKMKTVAFEDFDGNGVGSAMPASLLEKVGNDVNTARNKRAYVSGGSYLISNDEITSAENLTLEIDVQSFVPINRGGLNYNSPYGYMSDDWYFFNTDTATNPQEALALKIDQTGAALYGRVGGANGTSYVGGTYASLIHGDAARDSSGKVVVYKKGATFLEEHRVSSVSNLPAASTRDVKDPTHFMVIKNGNSLTFYADNNKILEGTATNQTKTKGAIRLFYAGASLFSLDNIRASVFEIEDETKLVADGRATTTASNVSGSIGIKNYTQGDVTLKAIVVAYGDNNEMLGAQVLGGVSGVNKTDYQNVAFTMPVSATAKKVKLFLWEDFSNRKQIISTDLTITQ